MWTNGHLRKNGNNAGFKEPSDFFFSLSKGLLDVIGAFFGQRYPEVFAGLSNPNAALPIIIVGEYSVNIKAKYKC
jgi:hypothetical protein